jgi:hypothetical protein
VMTALLHTDSKEGKPKTLGRFEIDIGPMIPELVDVYSVGIRRKVEFRRSRPGEPIDISTPIVGRCLITLKLVGDYLTKFDSASDGIKGAPKKAQSDIHQLPSESPDFNWRIRCYASNGENMPMGDVIA